MSEHSEKIPFFILDSNASPTLFITHYTKWGADLTSFPCFEWDVFIIDSPKGEDLILGYDFLYLFKPIINWKNGLITYDSSHKDSSGIKSYASNALAAAVNSVALVFKEIKDVGEDVASSSLHLFKGDKNLPPLSFHASLEEQWDEEEEPEEIEDVLKVVPPACHHYLDVFSKVKAEKRPPHHACDHHIDLKGLLPPVGVIYSLSSQDSETLQAYISENVEKGFIIPSSSSTGEPVFFVKKKDGGPYSSKFQQIINWPQTKNIKALQSFLGFANFYCCFIKNDFKKITALTSLLKKDSPIIFNEEALSQVQILREAFATAPILSHFNRSLPTIVETDASDYAWGAVLSQVNDSGKHPIAFDSRKLLQAELNYEIHDKELLGIVWALKHWRAFLLSSSNPFEVFTDNSSLHYFMSSKVLTCCQAHWAEFLSEFHFPITYRPGRLATLPDALSCLDKMYPERGVDFINKNLQNFHQVIKQDGIQKLRFFSIKVEILSDLIDQIQKEVWQDKDYEEILKQLARGESVTDYSIEPQAKLLLFKDRVVIPSNEEIQLNILHQHDDSPLAGHPFQEKTLNLTRGTFIGLA
ncbi:hypothetical protein O181_063972 [Austropuccinia psidii MF-1]|uniref:Reverse transcriptase RNase H-like domain-containing protein n=1 Tax=Austropuccinia psidii MF-1 TaxID=1389203 RepID=A0A9Q3EQL7_9BASI|nr:hypothetical protein [Austropuccinia psidii MF-1]